MESYWMQTRPRSIIRLSYWLSTPIMTFRRFASQSLIREKEKRRRAEERKERQNANEFSLNGREWNWEELNRWWDSIAHFTQQIVYWKKNLLLWNHYHYKMNRQWAVSALRNCRAFAWIVICWLPNWESYLISYFLNYFICLFKNAFIQYKN